MLDLFQIYTLRFERNGPNSTLQVDDHRKIVNTPDGEHWLFECLMVFFKHTLDIIILEIFKSININVCFYIGAQNFDPK